MPRKKLKEFLDHEGVPYVTVAHSPAFTAQEIAASAHVRGRELAKTVIVKLDGRMTMVVLPSDRLVDLEQLRAETGANDAELASEREFRDRFPDCDVGAMPPFGNLFDMPVLVDTTLAEDEEIVFNAGSHTELVRMAYADFERLARPRRIDVAVPVPG